MQNEVVEFQGFKFARYPESERNSDRVYFTGWVVWNGKRKKERLHRFIWMVENGDIPNGYHIHHADENPLNNTLGNLDCIKGFDHLSFHGKNVTAERAEQRTKHLVEVAIPKAAEWHRSEQGREWHKEHATRVYEAARRDVTCIECGQIRSSGNSRTQFCSTRCKNRYNMRIDRANGIYNETRNCGQCGKEFSVYRWSKIRNCSRSCGAKEREGLRLRG